MPHLYVAWHAGIHSDSSMPRLSKNPRSHGVEPSPTPMIADRRRFQHRDLDASLEQERANVSAVIHPAEPPPTMTTRRTGNVRPRPGGQAADRMSH